MGRDGAPYPTRKKAGEGEGHEAMASRCGNSLAGEEAVQIFTSPPPFACKGGGGEYGSEPSPPPKFINQPPFISNPN